MPSIAAQALLPLVPKVFISYRQINDAQRQRVRAFAERLRAQGVEVILDQFYKDTHPGGPPEGWPKWSSDQAIHAPKVLIIGNEAWFGCFDGQEKPGTGLGAACEAGIIRQRIYDLGGTQDIIRVACFDEADSSALSYELKRYDRFHAEDDFDNIIAWIGGAVPGPNTTDDEAVIPARLSKGWVWWSSVASHKAKLKSVLACVETLLAVCAYWWIAWRYDTHVHLVTSVLIAPLLLLRSPESIAAGLRWFEKDWFGFEGYEDWSKPRKTIWSSVAALLSGVATFYFAHRLSLSWLAVSEGWSLFGWSVTIGALSVFMAFAVAIAIALVVASKGQFDRRFQGAGAYAVVGVVGGVIAGASAGGIVTGVIFGAIPGYLLGLLIGGAGGLSIRALLSRILATLGNLMQGVAHLPENWLENNVITDSSLPAELMPGIRGYKPFFTLDGFLKNLRQYKKWWLRMLLPVAGIFYFFPAFLYRLNLKATAWFWWPLALLLKQAPTKSGEHDEMEAMCSPWTNPMRMILTWFSVLLGAGPILIQFLDFKAFRAWRQSDPSGVVPASWETFLSIRWTELAPWNWLQLVAAAAGAGILFMASNALSHMRTGNWANYRKSWGWRHGWMTFLRRVNFGASMSVMVLALGALALHSEPIRSKLSAPLVQAVDSFYARWTPPAKPSPMETIKHKLAPE